MPKFPIDAPKTKVLKTLKLLGFKTAREKEHIVMIRTNPDGSKTPLTIAARQGSAKREAGSPR